MALFEYKCLKCKTRFETIRQASDKDAVVCNRCGSPDVEKQISAFKVGGQGDLRESTMHGCHDCYTGAPDSGSHEGHDH